MNHDCKDIRKLYQLLQIKIVVTHQTILFVLQEEGNAAEDTAQDTMTHACIVDRSRALNVSTALCANLLLSDAPITYRHMTQPPVLAIAWVWHFPALC